MAKKKNQPLSVLKKIGEAVGDFVDAASVAATGSQLGVLELAAEEEFNPTRAKRKRKTKLARKVAVKSNKKAKTKRGVKRRR